MAQGEGVLSKVLGFETVSTSHLVMASAFSFSPSRHQQGTEGRRPGGHPGEQRRAPPSAGRGMVSPQLMAM
ncbi:MAG: hypothetical protein OXF25_02900 [Cyanobacteria bacterium MAG CAR3_bin_5]|nr:hypothetical protein [Cyanobacteria bacterium MAG CAR3_bin_5]